MYNDNITRKYMAYKGTRPTRGMRMDLSPLMHFFLMDCVRDMYKHFDKKPLAQDTQKLKNTWKQAMHDFDTRFWIPFKKTPMEDYIIDKLDDYCAWIAHDLEIARYAWESGSIDLPIEEQQAFSALWIANQLAADAQGVHFYQFKTPSGQKKLDHEIDAVLSSTKKLCEALYPDGILTERQFKQIDMAKEVIIKRTRLWLQKDADAEEAKVRADRKDKQDSKPLSADALADARQRLMQRFNAR